MTKNTKAKGVFMKYSEKLRDPRWQKKRLEAMNRDEFTCCACGDGESTLNVHHLQYHGDPWEAPLEHLETLCEACHENRTEVNKAFNLIPTGIAVDFYNDLLKAKMDELILLNEVYWHVVRMKEAPSWIPEGFSKIVKCVSYLFGKP